MKEQILKLRAEGKTYNEIKKELNCSKGTIAYHCGKNQKQKSNLRTKKNRKSPKTHLNHILNTRYYNIFIRGAKKNIKGHREKSNFSLSDFKRHILNNPVCYISGEILDLNLNNTWQVDHIIPLSKGGKTTLDNIKPVSKKANKSKSDLLLKDFLKLCEQCLMYHGYKVSRDGVEPPELKITDLQSVPLPLTV